MNNPYAFVEDAEEILKKNNKDVNYFEQSIKEIVSFVLEDIKQTLDPDKGNEISLEEENRKLKQFLLFIKNIRNTTLLTDPPQDAWKFYKIDERINELTSK